MKLLDLETNNAATKALKANFDFEFDPSTLNPYKAKSMLHKVKSLMKEAKSHSSYYDNQKNPTYMKLVFMEQALSNHLLSIKEPDIIFENEEVEKSQVILAAQDMVDSLQKMIEEVNDMLVKELPALTDSIQSEIGVNESQTFNSSATEALTSLNSTLGQSKASLQNALNGLTGVGVPGAFGAPAAGGGEMPVTDIGDQGNVEAPSLGSELDLPAEEPELPPVGKVGRSKR